MDEDASLALGGHHQHHGQKVWSESGPGGIGEGHDGAVQEGFYLVAVLLGDEDVVSALLQPDAQAAECVRDNAQVVPGYVLDGNGTAADGGHADERAHLDHVRENLVLRAVQGLYAVDAEEVAAHSVNESAHAAQHLAQLLDIGLAGRVVDGRGSLG